MNIIKISLAVTAMLANCTVSCSAFGMAMVENNMHSTLTNGNVYTGTIEAVSSGYSVNIDGVFYVFSAALAKLHDETGRSVSNLNLTKGTPVRFITRPDGSRQRIVELWVVKK